MPRIPDLTRYDPVQVGELIRHMRTAAGLTQPELAAPLGKSRASISNMEAGDHTVSLADLIKVAEICGYAFRLSVTKK